MEHRLNARECLAIPVMLYQYGLPMLCGTCADVSRGGLFVRTTGVRFRANECFEVELRSAQGRMQRIPAVVVHWREDGVGLMFNDLGDRLVQELEQLLDAERAVVNCGAAA